MIFPHPYIEIIITLFGLAAWQDLRTEHFTKGLATLIGLLGFSYHLAISIASVSGLPLLGFITATSASYLFLTGLSNRRYITPGDTYIISLVIGATLYLLPYTVSGLWLGTALFIGTSDPDNTTAPFLPPLFTGFLLAMIYALL